ncbi:MAG: DNA repair protein RadA [Candidatus Uhrbacteria bacterium]|nr:DNA repair protein RadA [Candidatus Uhrbacteria bacterium]
MFNCSNCDSQHLKWQGRCTECGKWGTLSEGEMPNAKNTKSKKGGAIAAPILDLGNATSQIVNHQPTGISELDRVLSGGIVPGSVTLIAGEPGIGKSTLVAQITASSPEPPLTSNLKGAGPLYVSGEESEGQVLMRFKRIGIAPDRISFSNSVEIGSIIAAARKLMPSLLVVDSIQTMISYEADALPGTPTAVRAATAELIGFAKSTQVPVLIIGQVTKEGSIAGPKTLEHLVDTLLTLEGDKNSQYRILRSSKNRFGSTDEVGIFEMTSSGMTAVLNPSARFLEERTQTPGSVVTCVMEGTRPLLVEVQALAEKSYFANPIRRTSGFDPGRLQMLLAIISKRAGISVSGHDVYVNVVGGMKIKETAADLAVCAAVISSIKEKTPQADAVFIGELGLGGEVRTVPFLDRRLKEAERLGFKNAITPKNLKSIRELGF